MGLEDNETQQSLFNRWNDDFTNTLQAYLTKQPLLNDGANTGGTETKVQGTGGTTHGTFQFSIPGGQIYVLHALAHNLVQSGTFGTIQLNGVKIDGINLGTLGPVSNFVTVYGEDLTAASHLKFEYQINGGTGLNGTFGVNCEVSGWKFPSRD